MVQDSKAVLNSEIDGAYWLLGRNRCCKLGVEKLAESDPNARLEGRRCDKGGMLRSSRLLREFEQCEQHQHRIRHLLVDLVLRATIVQGSKAILTPFCFMRIPHSRMLLPDAMRGFLLKSGKSYVLRAS